MRLTDLVIAGYPFYLSVEAIRHPRVALLKHCLIFWVLWFTLVVSSSLVELFFWWMPFISLFDTVKLLVLVSAYRPGVADNIRSFFIQPLWAKSKKVLPLYATVGLDRLQGFWPKAAHYRTKASKLFEDVSGVFKDASADRIELEANESDDVETPMVNHQPLRLRVTSPKSE